MFGLFRKKPKEAVTEPNPWLKIPHAHVWLMANEGTEWVCGDCGLRQPNETGERIPDGKIKKD